GEAELIDASLIRATCLVGTADALVEQVRELERQGLQELVFAIGVDEKWRVAEAFARGVIARLCHRTPRVLVLAQSVERRGLARDVPGLRRSKPTPARLTRADDQADATDDRAVPVRGDGS